MLQHWWFFPLTVMVPAGTTAAAPYTVAWPLWQGELNMVRVQIPPGHNGRTGLQVAYDGQVIIPWANQGWLTGSGDTFDIPWEGEIMAEGITVAAWNSDSVEHNFYCYAQVHPLGPGGGVLAGGGGGSQAGPATTIAAVKRLKHRAVTRKDVHSHPRAK
jgi:hypothetical protein